MALRGVLIYDTNNFFSLMKEISGADYSNSETFSDLIFFIKFFLKLSSKDFFFDKS